MIDAIKSVGVLGLGVMGFDIAFLYAQKGYRTLVYDAAEAALKNLTARRDQTIERLKRRNRISEIEVENVKNGLVAVPGVAGIAILPSLDAPAVPGVFKWNNVAPRIGITYAVDEARNRMPRAATSRSPASRSMTAGRSWKNSRRSRPR